MIITPVNEVRNNTIQALRRFGCPADVAAYLSKHIGIQTIPSREDVSKVLAWFKCTAHYETMGTESDIQYILAPEHLLLRNVSHGEKWTVFDIMSTPHTLYKYRRATHFSYWGDGITPRIIQYCEITDRKQISVMDIGSHDGEAMRCLQTDLSDFDISAETTGVDIDYFDGWQNNMNEFIHCDVFKLRPSRKYDVVLCTMAGYKISRQEWPTLIRACASHLTYDGILLFHDMVYEHYRTYDVDESRQLAHNIDSMSDLQFAWYEFGRTALYHIYCGNVTWERSPHCFHCVLEDMRSGPVPQPAAVVHMPNHVCDTCGDNTVCYVDTDHFQGWHCGRCTLALTGPDYLIRTLNRVAGIASWEPETAREFIRALLERANGPIAKNMLADIDGRIKEATAGRQGPNAEGTPEADRNTSKDGPHSMANGIWAEMSERARTFKIEYEFPDDLEVAYKQGRKEGPRYEKEQPVSHTQDIRWDEAFAPSKLRTFQAPVGQRWAVNYLRLECSGYKTACKKLLEEARNMLERDGRSASLEDNVVYEQIHRIIKNRVQNTIAKRFPELAAASKEQMI